MIAERHAHSINCKHTIMHVRAVTVTAGCVGGCVGGCAARTMMMSVMLPPLLSSSVLVLVFLAFVTSLYTLGFLQQLFLQCTVFST